MSQDEIAVMDGGKCICMLRGVRPFLSSKFDITQHSRYKYLSDADKENAFDVGKYLDRLRKPRPPVAPDEPFIFYEIHAGTGTGRACRAVRTTVHFDFDPDNGGTLSDGAYTDTWTDPETGESYSEALNFFQITSSVSFFIMI